ncbi:DNA-directed RNA polymerase subunit beta' [Candidatus Kuenenbacteria bacterium]|nr:DNA-directed RNA polymerase subunit beta' [Candidatus Kuenenbacteria bacterium]
MSLESLKINDFDAIRLKLASQEDIRSWSYGEVMRPETINYRTQKPEKDGLFCEKIFGPSKDWECYCGKYKKIRYKGIVCDKCGVEVTRAVVRRQRMGHINLAVPVSHIWFLRGVPSKVGLILDLSIQKLEKVIYFANFIVTDVDEDLKKQEVENLKKEYVSKQKAISSQSAQKMNMIKENKEMAGAEMKKALLEADKEKTEMIEELDEDYSVTEKELKELKPLKIISEIDYQDMSLKYGHVFEAGIGAEAIRKLLERVDITKLINELNEELKTDKGARRKKLINRVKLLKSLKRNKIKSEQMILTALPVIPPDLRPMVPLDGGRYATSDLNDLYRRVISRNNRLRRLLELNAPEVIIRNEKRMLQEACDALIDNSARQSKTTTASTGQKRKLKSIADYLKGKRGRFRQNLLGKRIDYSGRSVIVIGPDLRLHQCGIPKKMALELFKPFVISQLIKKEYVHNIRSANRFIEADRPEVWDILEKIVKEAHVLLNRAPTLHRLGIQAFQPVLIEGKAIQLHPLVCSAFNADFDGDQMAVHLPLTEEAKTEAKEKMLASKNLLKPATGNSIVTPTMDMVWGSYYVTSQMDRKDPVKIFASVKEAKIAYDLRKINLRQVIKVKVNKGELASKIKENIFETSLGRILFNNLLPSKMPYFDELIDKKKMAYIVQLCLEFYGFEKTAIVLDNIKDFGFKQLTKTGFSWGMGDLPDVEGKQAQIEKGMKEVDEVQSQYEEGLLTNDERYSKVIEVWTRIKDEVTKMSQNVLAEGGSVHTMINSGARGSWGQLAQMLGMKGLVTNPAGQIIELPVKASFKEGFSVLEYYISTHGTRKGLSDTALRTANAGYLTRRLVDVAQDIVIKQDDCKIDKGRVITKKESDEMGLKLVERIVGRYLVEAIKSEKTGKVVVKAGELITEEIARKLEKVEFNSVHIRSLLNCKLIKGACKKCYGYDLAYNQPVEMGTAVGIIAAQSIGEPGTQLTMRTFHTGGVAGGDDITQGLPRVEEIFEARPPKKKALIADADGLISVEEQERTIQGPKGEIIAKTSFGQRILKITTDEREEDVYDLKPEFTLKVKNGATIGEKDVLYIDAAKKKVKAKRYGIAELTDTELKVISTVDSVKEFIIPPGTVLWVKDGEMVKRGAQLTEGSLDLSQLYKISGRLAVQDYILKEIQYIYSSQGQKLNDKHVELISRQMFSRVYVENSGDTDLLEGEVVEKATFFEANKNIKKGGKKAAGDEIFLGISKVSLSTNSFLSAASFQETARVLINAAVTGRIDSLEGLKENVIIGRLIPAGTGFQKQVKSK